MEESKEDILSETPLLLVEPPNSEVKVADASDSVHDSGGRTTDSGLFRRWFEEFWLKRSLPSPAQKHVDGWPEILLTKCPNDDWSPHCGLQDQQWEQLSAHSSHLGIVKTASFTDQSVGRSRAATQSTFNPSIHSGGRGSIESLRPTVSPSISHAVLLHSLERRQILREIITTESDYVFGLKALADVCPKAVSRAIDLETDLFPSMTRYFSFVPSGSRYIATSNRFENYTRPSWPGLVP
jgi:hypothetical protein